MAFDITQFRSQMVGDGARPNLFEVELSFPFYVQNVVGGPLAQKLTFMARATQLPGSIVNQVPVMYFGRELKFAGNRTFPEWTITVINDEDFTVRKAFETWMDGINSHRSNVRTSVFQNAGVGGNTTGNGYQAEAKVKQYGKVGDPGSGVGRIKKQYKFIGVFPIDVSPIELDWGSNDNIEEFSVTFAYQWWESDTTT